MRDNFVIAPVSARPLVRVGLRYLSRHPWQTALMVVGVMLGVAVMVAIDLANAAASRAFDLSTEAIAGKYPKSWVKILFAVLGVLAVVGIVLLLANRH